MDLEVERFHVKVKVSQLRISSRMNGLLLLFYNNFTHEFIGMFGESESSITFAKIVLSVCLSRVNINTIINGRTIAKRALN